MNMAAAVPVKSARRDWFRIIRDLSGAGVSAGTIGRKCNRNASTVIAWANGGDPKESDARIVLSLYALHCPLRYLRHQEEYAISVSLSWRDVVRRLAEGEDELGIAAELETTPDNLREWLAEQQAATQVPLASGSDGEAGDA
jgi:hypothetical protein